MMHQIVIAGFGGQGIMTMGQFLAYAGMLEGKAVSWLPSYGPEMRGGTANCHVIISSEGAVGSPIVTDATAVIVMNRPSLAKFEPLTIPGGLLLINASLITDKSRREDIEVLYIPANEIADELKDTRVANMVMLGAYLKRMEAVSLQSIEAAMKKAFGEKKAGLIPLNMEALKRGADCVAG
jgi:2-oxoglutarate ferredoxin oxidoreductase subunit gamma